MRRWLFPVFCTLALIALVSGPTSAGPAQITPLPPVEGTDGRAGACYSFYDPPERPYIPMARNAGSRWDRFDFSWPALEPTNDSWDFGQHDQLLYDLRAGGIENVVGILLWTPDWAASGGVTSLSVPRFGHRPPGWFAPVPRTSVTSQAISAASSPPQGLYEEWNDWTTADDPPVNHWGDFVYQTVLHFGDRVKHWEVWNEPEWSFFWSGTEADYAQLLKVGYQATKAACPDCTVLYGGLHFWADQQYFERVLDILNDDPDAPANNYFFDVMSVHLYSTTSTVYDVVNHIRSRMGAFVPAHPIWLTETGVPVWDDAAADSDPVEEYDWTATQDEAAAFVIQSYANAWAAGVQRYFFFRTHDGDMIDDSVAPAFFGLIRNDRTLRPAYVAYQVAATYLVSPTMATKVSYGASGRRVTLWGTPRGKVSVLWNAEPITIPFDYPATLSTGTLVDRWGVTQTITATSGVYSLTLPGATANLLSDPGDYIIGGEPYLVIEADTTPPTATVHALPTTTYTDTIPVSWEGGDDAAGIWRYDVQVREGTGGGSWTDWAVFTAATSRGYGDAQSSTTYCFRARAWDRAGNRGEWPAEPQACTTVRLERQVHFGLGAVFGDENANGVQDGDEATLEVSLRLVDGAGVDLIAPTVGSSWEFTATLPVGDHTLIATPNSWPSSPEWFPRRLPVVVELGEGGQEVLLQGVGLPPPQGWVYLPALLRDK